MNASEKDSKNSVKGWFRPRVLPRRQYLIAVGLFALFGVIAGYAYYALVGCRTGSCAITSSPTMSMIWGGLMGYLLPDFFVKQEKNDS